MSGVLDILTLAKTAIRTGKGVTLDDPQMELILMLEPDEAKREAIRQELEYFLSVQQSQAAVLDKGDHQPWVNELDKENWRYSRRYHDYLLGQGFPQRVLENIENINLQILDRLGNPNAHKAFKRKGLVVGHVQSGKTANYLSLMNFAIDSGYKLIILIAGIHNNLRSQTQQRVNEGVIGYDWLRRQVVGVAEFNEDGVRRFESGDGNIPRPISLTNIEKDFHRNNQEVAGFSPDQVSTAVVLVVKKNVSTLRNLLNWLQGGNESTQSLLQYPTLLIDDEADNASINTAKNPDDVTRINEQIRQILNQFEKVSYVAYTATPFANIFIDPDTDDEMLQDDLFPEHFIFSLNPPDNYLGPDDFFGGSEEGEISPYCELIDDYQETIPLSMKRGWVIRGLPQSLKTAIAQYLLCMGVKKLRGTKNKHSSMLVNISFRTVQQKQVAELIREELSRLKRAIRYEGGRAQYLSDPMIKSLHDLYQGLDIVEKPSFECVLQMLVATVDDVQVKVINTGSEDRLNYMDYPEGLDVIAVGGYSLSRGLTLEGLLISYLIRNTKTYDTLLQMGRWFGYRDGYRDLCMLFLPEDAYDWYSFITQANQELRNEFKIMERHHLTPRDYGLRVRTSPDGLMVTARNKMYRSERVSDSVSFSAQLISPLLLPISGRVYEENQAHLIKFVSELCQNYVYVPSDKVKEKACFWSNVKTSDVLAFLAQYQILDEDLLKAEVLKNYIDLGLSYELAEWDVLLCASGRGSIIQDMPWNLPFELNHQERQFAVSKFSQLEDGEAVSFTDAGGRVARIWEEAYGLSEEARQKADEELKASDTKQTARWYREYRERPLLILKLFEVREKESGSIKAQKVPAFAISFPPEEGPRRSVDYQVNKIYMQNMFDTTDESEEEAE